METGSQTLSKVDITETPWRPAAKPPHVRKLTPVPAAPILGCTAPDSRFSRLGFQLHAGVLSALGDFRRLSASQDASRAVTLAGSLSAGTFKLILSCKYRHFSWWPLCFHWWSFEFLLPVLSSPVLQMKVTSHYLLFTVCPPISWKGVKIRT